MTKDELNSSWIIEEVYSSEDCRHIDPSFEDDVFNCKILTEKSSGSDYILCNKENCPLRVGKGEK